MTFSTKGLRRYTRAVLMDHPMLRSVTAKDLMGFLRIMVTNDAEVDLKHDSDQMEIVRESMELTTIEGTETCVVTWWVRLHETSDWGKEG